MVSFLIIVKKFIPIFSYTRLIILITLIPFNQGQCKVKEDSVIQTIYISSKSLEFKNGRSHSPSQYQYFIFENPSKENLWIKLRMENSKPSFFVIPGRSSYELKKPLNKKDRPVIEVLSPSGNSFELFPHS